MLTELSSDDTVISERNSHSIDLSVSSLVDEVVDGGSGWETVSDEWLNHLDHVPGSFVELDEHSVVQLS